MLSNELLSSAHGQVALRAVHRFLTHNAEWVGQTLGAGLCQDREEGGGGGADHKIVPWGYCVYRQTHSHDMITNIGGVKMSQVMGYTIDWEAAYRLHTAHHNTTSIHIVMLRYTQDAPEVVVQMLLSRRAEMTELVDTDEAEKKMLDEIRGMSVRGGAGVVTRQVTAQS